MSDEQINIKIAEMCGWTPADEQVIRSRAGDAAWLLRRGPWWRNDAEKTVATVEDLPNYTSDLNACHEFAAWLNLEQQIKFAEELQCIILENPYRAWWDATAMEVFQIADATARQRCEAFLRVHGQWEEEA